VAGPPLEWTHADAGRALVLAFALLGLLDDPQPIVSAAAVPTISVVIRPRFVMAILSRAVPRVAVDDALTVESAGLSPVSGGHELLLAPVEESREEKACLEEQIQRYRLEQECDGVAGQEGRHGPAGEDRVATVMP
jgi:hypothetical protein